MDDKKLKTSVERIQRDIEELAKFSETPGVGCRRFSYTPEFAGARDYIMEEMRAAGLDVREDPVGIVIGRMEGSDPNAPAIMTGSHFDTVKTGGIFDGPAGVVAAMETARVLHEEGFQPKRPIEFVALPEEEGARFGGTLFGSRAICGKFYDGEIENNKDWNGVTIAEAMKEYGLDPSKAGEAQRDPDEIGDYIELHIEQGKILEGGEAKVGIIDAIAGFRFMKYTVHGRSDHAGNTPMDQRADTMLAAVRAINAGTDKALEIGDTVCTCGNLVTDPGVFNIVAKETMFQIDCRSRYQENMDAVYKVIEDSLNKSCETFPDLSWEAVETMYAAPVEMNEHTMTVLEDEAEAAGIKTRHMISGAGHDAMVMGGICRAAMLFVPSKDGKSHVPEEWTDYEDLQQGVEVLYRTVKKLASEE